MPITVRAVPWPGGFELHIDNYGVRQCRIFNEAEHMVLDYLRHDGVYTNYLVIVVTT